jgi:hypothetical protein
LANMEPEFLECARHQESHEKVIPQEIVSLDRYAAGPNGDVNFIPASNEEVVQQQWQQLRRSRRVRGQCARASDHSGP